MTDKKTETYIFKDGSRVELPKIGYDSSWEEFDEYFNEFGKEMDCRRVEKDKTQSDKKKSKNHWWELF